MIDRPRPLSDDQLDALLAAAGDRLEYPAMSDPAAVARARIERRATTASQPGSPNDVIPLPGRETTPIPPPAPSEPERLGRDETSRLREFALFGGGLAAAAIIILILALVFRGFDDSGEDDPTPAIADSPLAAEPYDIPGYEFVATAGQPQVPNEPVDVAIGPDGRLYVLDLGLQRVVAFTEDGEVDTDWGDEGFSVTIPRTFGAAIGAGPDGRVYVATEQVLVFDVNGEQVDSWPFPDGAGDRTGDPRVHGLVVDSEGNVYVAGRGAIWRFEPRTGAATTIELESEFDLQIQIDGRDQLYAASRAGGIYRLSDEGELEPIGRTSGQEDVNGLAVARDGSFVVFRISRGSDDPSTFFIVDRDGSEIASWPIERVGSWIGTFSPLWIGIEVQPDGTIVLPDPQGHRVSFYDPDGRLVSEIRDERSDAFGRLWRISVDGSGNVLGFDPSEEPEVLRFAPDGELLQEMPFESALLGSMATQFQGNAFTATGEGGFIVAHGMNSVAVYSPEGDLLQEWEPGAMESDAALLFPSALTVDEEGSVYIVDEGFAARFVDNLRKFTIDGEFVAEVGAISDPTRTDIVHHDGAIWAIDDGAIVRYPGDGGEPETIAAPDVGDDGRDLPGLPITLAVDPEGNIITHMFRLGGEQRQFPHMLAKLDSNGRVIWTVDLPDDSGNRYVDLAIAPDGTLYISDSHLRQILVYRPTGEAQTPESTATVDADHQNIASDLLVVERAADAGGPPKFGIYEPVSSDINDLPPGELVGISPDHKILLMIDREPGEEWVRLELIAVSTETLEELWRTDIGALNQNRPNTIYYDMTVIGDTAYVAMHDPDFRREMLEVAEVHLSDGALISVSGLDTNLLELGQPGIHVDLLASPESSYPTVLITNTNSGELLRIGRERFRIFGDLALPIGTPRLLPDDKGLFIIPPTGIEARPAIFYLTFDDMALGEIALPFAALSDSSGSFTEYAVANDGRTLYALSLNSSQVAIVNLERLEVQQIVELDNEPIYSLTGDMEWTTLTPYYADHPISFSPDGRYMYCLGYPRDHPGSRPGQGLVTYTPPVWKIDTTTWEIVNDWAPEAPWLAHAVHSSGDGRQLYVSLGTLAEVDDPDAPFRLTTENHGFAVLSTDALENQTGYVVLNGYQLVGTLADVYRETHGISPGYPASAAS